MFENFTIICNTIIKSCTKIACGSSELNVLFTYYAGSNIQNASE